MDDQLFLKNVRAIINEFLKAGAPGCQDYARLNETAIETDKRIKNKK